MAHPASSRSTNVDLSSNRTILSGETLRVDSVSVANNTAAPVVVQFQSADGLSVYRKIVVPAFDTISDDFIFIADKGLLIPSVSADVHVNLSHSSGGV